MKPRFNSAGLYVQDAWEAIPDRLRITGALRYSSVAYDVRAADAPVVAGRPLWNDDSLRTGGFSGRIGGVLRVVKGLRLAANYSRGFRYPAITDLGTLGLTGDGFEVDYLASSALGGMIGTTAGTDAVSTGLPVEKQRSEISNNIDFSVRYQNKRFDTEFTVFRLDIEDAITKQALILPAGSVGRLLGSDVITSQNANGAVFVAAVRQPGHRQGEFYCRQAFRGRIRSGRKNNRLAFGTREFHIYPRGGQGHRRSAEYRGRNTAADRVPEPPLCTVALLDRRLFDHCRQAGPPFKPRPRRPPDRRGPQPGADRKLFPPRRLCLRAYEERRRHLQRKCKHATRWSRPGKISRPFLQECSARATRRRPCLLHCRRTRRSIYAAVLPSTRKPACISRLRIFSTSFTATRAGASTAPGGVLQLNCATGFSWIARTLACMNAQRSNPP